MTDEGREDREYWNVKYDEGDIVFEYDDDDEDVIEPWMYDDEDGEDDE